MKHTQLERIFKNLLLFSVVCLTLAIIILLFKLFIPTFHFANENPLPWIALSSLISFLFIRKYDKKVSSFLNRIVFPSRHLQRIKMVQLVEEMIGELDVKNLAQLIIDRIVSIFGVEHLALFVHSEVDDGFVLVENHGLSLNSRYYSVPHDHSIVLSMKKKKKYVFYKKSYHFLSWQEAVSVDNFFESYSASIVFPFFFRGKLIAFMTLAESRNEAYDKEIINFYYVISKYAGQAFSNALLFGGVQRQLNDAIDTQGHLVQKLKLESIEKLATGIAHEVRNPLTIISLKAQTLLRKKDQGISKQEFNDALKLFLHQIRRASDITSRLIKFSENCNDITPVNLIELIDEITNFLSYRVSSNNIKILKMIDPSLPYFHAVHSDMRELFLSIFMNALDSVKKDGSILCYVRYEPVKRVISVHLLDDGIGFEEKENVAGYFDPFATTKEKGNPGLGLYVCQQITNKYFGNMKVQNNVPKGVDLFIELPLKNQEVKLINQDSEYESDGFSMDNDSQDSIDILPYEIMRDVVFNKTGEA